MTLGGRVGQIWAWWFSGPASGSDHVPVPSERLELAVLHRSLSNFLIVQLFHLRLLFKLCEWPMFSFHGRLCSVDGRWTANSVFYIPRSWSNLKPLSHVLSLSLSLPARILSCSNFHDFNLESIPKKKRLRTHKRPWNHSFLCWLNGSSSSSSLYCSFS